MKRSILKGNGMVAVMMLSLFVLFADAVNAQSSSKSIEMSTSDDGSITLKVTKDVDGERKTFEKTYSSREEMENDPEYKEFFGEEPDFQWFSNDDNAFSFSFGDSKDIMLDLHKNFGLNFDSEDMQGFFKNLEGDGENFFFHLDGDESIEDLKQRMKDMGHDIDVDVFEYTDEMEEALQDVKERLKDINSQFDDFNIDFHVSPKSGSNKMIIIERKTLTISDIHSDDDDVAKYSKSNNLKVDDLSYYPNPNDGRFTLRFKMPEQAPLKVTILDLAGKEVYSESFSSFGGLFKEEMDLSDQDAGIYLLEIASGKKKMTKKLVLE